MTFIEVLFAVFLPPIAVLMRTGVSTSLFINILLTIVGWIPGVIHALWVIASKPKGVATA